MRKVISDFLRGARDAFGGAKDEETPTERYEARDGGQVKRGAFREGDTKVGMEDEEKALRKRRNTGNESEVFGAI